MYLVCYVNHAKKREDGECQLMARTVEISIPWPFEHTELLYKKTFSRSQCAPYFCSLKYVGKREYVGRRRWGGRWRWRERTKMGREMDAERKRWRWFRIQR